jgi:cation/acetate symporter
MSLTSRQRLVNPRLGTYFGIFVSALAGLVLLLLIFEQLGASERLLRLFMFAGPVLLYSVLGLAAASRDPLEFFAAGRRVPAFYGGLGLAVTAMGATGTVALTGLFFLVGFDALCVVTVGLAGFVIMAVLLAPFIRKFGAFTLPSYLGRRFDSRAVRLAAAALLSVPILLALAAELRMGAFAASALVGITTGDAMLLIVVAVAAPTLLGGLRSATWAGVAQGIAAVLALLVTVALVAVLVTHLPIPQLTHGPLVRGLLRTEAAQGVPILLPTFFAFDLAGDGFQTIAKRYTAPFGAMGPGGFLVATLTLMGGVAAAPWLLPRVATAPGVYEARKSLGWATFIFGIVMLTVSGVAVFMRDALMDAVLAGEGSLAAGWLERLVGLGFVDAEARSARLAMTSIAFKRDAVLFSLPIAIGLPAVFFYLLLAGAVAAALATASATAVALGTVLAEDVVNGLAWEPAPPLWRLLIARAAIAVAAALGGGIAVAAPTDPLRLLLWAFALTGAAAFPVVVLSIWWKRINAFGALAGLTTGFTVTMLAIVAGEAGWIGLDSVLAGMFGLPLAALAAGLVSLITPAPARNLLELVRDIRVPGGEILYDRETRLARLKQRQRA